MKTKINRKDFIGLGMAFAAAGESMIELVVKNGSATAPPLLCAQQPRKSYHISSNAEETQALEQCMELPSGCGWVVRRIKRSSF